MTTRPTPSATRKAKLDIGSHLRNWRKLQRLTAQQVADRAGINRNTLGRLERGDGSADLEAVLNVVRALGQLDAFVAALDPYETALGRARSEQELPQRVRP